jgi:hypothetical protein
MDSLNQQLFISHIYIDKRSSILHFYLLTLNFIRALCDQDDFNNKGIH